MYRSEGRMKNRKTIMALPLLGVSGLIMVMMYMMIKQTKEMKPPNPSFQSAKISPASAKPQIINIMICKVMKEVKGEPAFLFKPSINSPIPMNRVKATRKVPVIRAIHLTMLANRFFVSCL
jgi:hypothetical protein